MTEAARIAAGYDYTFYGVRNSDGYLQGNDGTGAAAGNTNGQGMLRLEGGRTIPVSIPQDEVVTPTGDNEPTVSFTFPSSNLPSGILETASKNLDFEALCQGTKVETVGGLSVGLQGPSGSTKENMVLLLMRQAKKWAAGVRGVAAWECQFVPSCEISPLGGDWTERQFSPYRYGINISKADRFPWGATYTEAVHGATSSALVPIFSDNPIQLHAFQGNGSQDTFILDVAPISLAKTYVYVNGVKQVPTTQFTLSSKTVTFVSPPASSAIINVMYEVAAADL